MKRLLIYPFLILIVSACDSEDAWDMFKSAGSVVLEERVVEPFSSISLLDGMTLSIAQDSMNWLKVTGPKNIIADITSEVIDGELILQDNNTFEFVRGYSHSILIEVGVDKLTSLYLEGPGNVYSIDTLKGGYLRISGRNYSGDVNLTLDLDRLSLYFIFSSLDFTAQGRADRLFISNHSTGFIRCRNLKSVSTEIKARSSGDTYVNVSENLTATIESIGDVLYYGSPTDTTFSHTIKGKGYFINMEE